jgi:hypothetical protein
VATHLVHFDVFAVKLKGHDAVADVCLPPHRHGAQIKELHVAVVVPRGQAPADADSGMRAWCSVAQCGVVGCGAVLSGKRSNSKRGKE